jgi:hypothetical protein
VVEGAWQQQQQHQHGHNVQHSPSFAATPQASQPCLGHANTTNDGGGVSVKDVGALIIQHQ